jgi:site-specific DNA recombinase
VTAAAIYSRVSTEDQEKEGTSLGSQVEACLKKARELNLEVPDKLIYRETYSGLVLDRPQLTVLRSEAAGGKLSAVIIHTPDRLSRVGEDILSLVKEFKTHGVKLHFVREQWDDTLNGKMVAFMLGWASEFEAAQFKERSMRGKRARAAAGRLPSGTGRRLYGYDYIKGKGPGEGIRYVNDTEASRVRDIYAWFTKDGLTINAITRRLRALEVPTPGGSPFWRRQTVYRMLTNPAYTGKTYAFTRDYVVPKRRRNPETSRKKTGVVWKPKEEWVEIPGATPAIITEERFEAAQRLLKRNKELAIRNARRQYFLSGYIFCRCGARYIGYVKKWKDNGKPNEQRYYRCGNSQSIASPNRCDNRQLNAPQVEGEVWAQIEKLLTKPELVLAELGKKEAEARKNSQQYGRWLDALRGVEARLKNVERQKDRAWKAFELTGDEERFKCDIAQADDAKKALGEQKAELERAIQDFEQAQIDIANVKKACELVKANLDNITYEVKRLTLEYLAIRVVVDGDQVTIRGRIPQIESADSLSITTPRATQTPRRTT